MHSSKVLVEILLPREALPSMSLAVWMRTHHLCLGTAVFAVDFSFVPQQSTRIRESLQFGTLWMRTAIWPVMLVHVFAPFAFAVEYLSFALWREIADVFALWVCGWVAALECARSSRREIVSRIMW